MVDENPAFKPQVQDIEDKVYSKYDIINRSNFEKFANELAKNDSEIWGLMLEIKELFKLAILGVIKPISIELPM